MEKRNSKSEEQALSHSTGVPIEYFNCFNTDEDEIMENADRYQVYSTEEVVDLPRLAFIEWECNSNQQVDETTVDPTMKRLVDFESWQQERKTIDMNQTTSQPVIPIRAEISKSTKKKKNLTANKRGPYRNYTPWQVQKLLDLVIETGMSARRVSIESGIAIRTGQSYVRQYKLKEDPEFLPGKKFGYQGGNNVKFSAEHTKFLINYFDTNSDAVLWEARDALISTFPELNVSLSAIHNHLRDKCTLTLKKLGKIYESRNSERTINLRKEIVQKWINDPFMDYATNCVFIDEAGFNMHLRRNFGRSKRGIPAKTVVPSNRGLNISIIGAICEKGVIDLTIRKSRVVQPSKSKSKKRKLNNDKKAHISGDQIEANETEESAGTNANHFLKFIIGVLDCLDKNNMQGINVIL
jgi:hypothetical protein